MVTAILIPVIFLYFYWLTLKEMKRNEEEWVGLSATPEEALIQGIVVEVSGRKERFYYHRFNYVLVLKIQSGNKPHTCQKVIPLTRRMRIPVFKIGETVILYGSWKTGDFRINRIIRKD